MVTQAIELEKSEYWIEALSAAKRAQAVLAGVGADPALRKQIEDVVVDLEMAYRLQEARLKGTGQKDDHFDREATASAIAMAFEWYGLDVDRLEPQEVAERIGSRPVAIQLAASLDIWAMERRQTNGDWGQRLRFDFRPCAGKCSTVM